MAMTITVSVEDSVAQVVASKLPIVPRKKHEVCVLGKGKRPQKNDIAMVCLEDPDLFRGRFLRAPVYRQAEDYGYANMPEWAHGCAGVIIVNHEAGDMIDSVECQQALTQALRIGWRRMCRRREK